MTENIGIYGEMRRRFLKKHRNAICIGMVINDTLWEHLITIDQQANEMMGLLTQQMKAAEGITEALKANDQMEWVCRMNSIHDRAREVVLKDLIYS